MRRLLVMGLMGSALAVLQCGTAAAHGPCNGCVAPSNAQPGQRIKVDYSTYLAIWNPGKAPLTKGPTPNCYGCQLGLRRDHVSGTPAIIVFEHRPRAPEFSFAVPDVPPGKYLIALFDGSEGGGHYTWSYVTVAGAGDGRESKDDGSGMLIAAVIVVSVLLISGAWFGCRRILNS